MKKLTLYLALAVLLGCAQGPAPVPIDAPDATQAETEIAAMLASTLPEGAMTRAASIVVSLAIVVDACHGAGVYNDLLVVWSTPNHVGPETDAVVAACSNICDDLFVVLRLRGWTVMPVCPPPERLLALADLQYLGTFLVPGRDPTVRREYGDLSYIPGRGTLMVSGASGIVEVLIPTTLGTTLADSPTAAQVDGALSPFDRCRPLIGVIPNQWYQSNGFCMAGRDLWISSLWYYNTGGNTYPSLCVAVDVLSTGLASPSMAGAYYVGNLHPNRATPSQAGGGFTVIDPAWAARVLGPGTWVASGGHRDAGAFNSGRGPNLYAWRTDLALPAAGGQLQPGTLLAYYAAAPATEFQGYRAPCPFEAEWCYTRDGRSGVVVGMNKGTMTDAEAAALVVQYGSSHVTNHKEGASWYGTGQGWGASCGADYRGYYAFPYEPRLYLVDPAAYEAVVLQGAASSSPQPTEEIRPTWTWGDPGGSTSSYCETNWFNGLSWDPEHDRLYVLHEGHAVHVLEF
jgi:hypothetical protein